MKLPAELVHRLRPAISGRSVCVTGGCGFIGGHLVDALLALGARVVIIDDLSNSTAELALAHMELEPAALKLVHGSILDPEALDEAIAGADTVFHLAAVGSVQLSIENPVRSWAVNADGTAMVLQAARRAGVKRIVYSASSSAYGDAPPPAAQSAGEVAARVESAAPAPLSPYAASKLAGELAVRAWCKSYGLAGVSLRYFNVFGPRQPADSAYSAVIASFARKLFAGEVPVIYGDGTQSRDFTPVACAVAANLLAAATKNPLTGQVVNIGTGQRTDLLTLARMLAAKAGRTLGGPGTVAPGDSTRTSGHASGIDFRPARTGDVRHSLADVSAARVLLDYQPIGTLDEALAETMDWYRAQFARA